MMATIIRSKKFSGIAGYSGSVILRRSRRISLIFALLAQMASAESQRLPVIHNVGLIPPQWENFSQDNSSVKSFADRVQKVYSDSARRSNRFNILNDELVSTLWSNPEGRAELAAQYELQAFLGLTLAQRGDVISVVARLMDARLNVLLAESVNTNASILRTSGEDELIPVLSDLFFRLINRLPIDATITSVQGRFVTLSGGENQGMRLGEQVEILRPFIETTHAADGTWLTFKNEKIGSAKLVEIKKFASVARLLTLNYEDAAQVGDGIKVEHIRSRSYFARTDEKQEFEDAKDEIIFPSLKDGKPVKGKNQVDQIPQLKSKKEPDVEQPAGEVSEAQEPENAEGKEPEAADEASDASESQMPIMEALAGLFKSASAAIGPRMWSASGDAEAAAKFPPWFFNYLALAGTGHLTPKLNYDLFGNLEFGQTADGNYTGFGFGSRLYATRKMKLLPGIDRVRMGVLGMFESRAINNETFGGGDILNLGVLGGVGGGANFVGSPIDWRSDLTVLLLSMGQMGVKGTKEAVKSGLGYALDGDFFFTKRPHSVEWGGGLKIASQSLTSSSSAVKLFEYCLLFNARYRF